MSDAVVKLLREIVHLRESMLERVLPLQEEGAISTDEIDQRRLDLLQAKLELAREEQYMEKFK